jgi:hypothetical protein
MLLAHNAEFVGLKADRLDARPYSEPANLRQPDAPPKEKVSQFNGIKIYKTGELQRPKMWVKALSSMKNALLQRSDWQGGEIEGLNLTGSQMDDANIQDTIWRGTVHNRQNFKRLRLRPQPGRSVQFLPSDKAPFRTKEAKQAQTKLAKWEQQTAAIQKLSGKKRQKAKADLREKPLQPEDYCQFVKANLNGKNLTGVEISGLRFKDAYISYINLKHALIKGTQVETIVKNPRSYIAEAEILIQILKGIKFKPNQPPVLDNTKIIKAKSISDTDASTFKQKHILAKQKSVQQHILLLDAIKNKTFLSGGQS